MLVNNFFVVADDPSQTLDLDAPVLDRLIELGDLLLTAMRIHTRELRPVPVAGHLRQFVLQPRLLLKRASRAFARSRS